MTKKILASALVALATFGTANAGGILTNTNQSVSFLRMPAREASIGIDGVYSNPAGVAFMKDGWHLGGTWQCAVQERNVTTTSPYLDHTIGHLDQNGNAVSPESHTRNYNGHATAPFIPSVSAAYNWKDKWSFQFHFAVSGGGGKCDFENGLGSFESAVGQIAERCQEVGAMGYGCENYMSGRQYYYGITLGAAYKVLPNLSIYGGLRGLIASATYSAQIKNIQVATSNGLYSLGDFIDNNPYLAAKKDYANSILNRADAQQAYAAYTANPALIEAGAAAQNPTAVAVKKGYEGYMAAQKGLQEEIPAAQAKMETLLNPYRNGIDLQDDQTGFGIAPIIGIDYKIGRFNFAAKYEFRTKMSLNNSSNLELENAQLAATRSFANGTSTREDSPALLAVGAQYSPIDIVRVNFGYHHFYDKDAEKTYFYTDATGSVVRSDDKNSLLSHGTDEYLGGVEVDATDRLILSCGAQITRYGMTDEYMNDISFVTNSWSLGFGASYQANKNVKIEAGYFKTFYDHYKTATSPKDGSYNDFTRTNDVIGVGLVVDL